MAMLRRRAKDDKVMVRKSSLQVIENIMRLNPGCVTPENLQVGGVDEVVILISPGH